MQVKEIKFAAAALVLTLCALVYLSQSILLKPEYHTETSQSRGGSLKNHFYIWNQMWDEHVQEATDQWRDLSDSYHVLIASFDKKHQVKRIDVNWNSLMGFKEVTFVIRINGSTLPQIDRVLKEFDTAIDQMSANSSVRLEIDFDAATSKLEAYSKWLGHLKSKTQYKLGITTIPTWLESPHLRDLLNPLDFYVLQVHSVLSPEQGLFDKQLAFQWSQSFSNLTDTPFLISLPNYWYEAILDRNDKILHLQAEQFTLHKTGFNREIFANPKDVARFISQFEDQAVENFNGWIWFRLINNKDQRTYASTTLSHLIKGDRNWNNDKINMVLTPVNQTSSNFDFWIENNTNVNLVAQKEWSVSPSCRLKHTIEGVEFNSNKITLNSQKMMKPYQKIRLGWGVCSNNTSPVSKL